MKKNEIFAEFIGMQKTDLGWFDYEEVLNTKGSNTFDELLFDQSWDWLMAVVRKVEELGYEVLIMGISCSVNKVLDRDNPIVTWVCGDKSNKIGLVYTTMFEFIKWYNQNHSK